LLIAERILKLRVRVVSPKKVKKPERRIRIGNKTFGVFIRVRESTLFKGWFEAAAIVCSTGREPRAALKLEAETRELAECRMKNALQSISATDFLDRTFNSRPAQFRTLAERIHISDLALAGRWIS